MSAPTNAGSGMYDGLALLNEINQVASGFDGVGVVFPAVSLALPTLEPAELGFIRVVSWLFVHYYEAGRIGTDFLGKLSRSYGLDGNGAGQAHRSRVQRLRTYCQHNLVLTEEHGKTIQDECQVWFKEKCGTSVPGYEDHWRMLLTSLVSEAKEFLTCLRDTVRRIERDPASESILSQWTAKIRRFHMPYEFDAIVEEVAEDLGRSAIDPRKFCAKHYDKWRKEFELRDDDCDFKVEARKLVEHAFLHEAQNVLPLTARDIMASFDIQPGVEVGKLLGLARALFDELPCDRDELLARIRAARSA
jgi:hypothetical protein